MLDVTPQPTLRPTVSPTAVPTTDGQVSRDDPINTSFCGTSLLSVREKNGAGVPILVEGRVGIVGASDGGDGAAYVRALKDAGAFGAIVGGGIAAVNEEDVADSLVGWSL